MGSLEAYMMNPDTASHNITRWKRLYYNSDTRIKPGRKLSFHLHTTPGVFLALHLPNYS